MIDSHGREITYLRLSVTDLCNLRCRYCMPEEGVEKRTHQEMLRTEERIDAVQAAVALGIRKIRITGGEPLVKRGIEKLCEQIATIPGVEELCLTTNGTLFSGKANALKEAGVDRLNISLDTLDPDKYRHITRTGNLQDALAGIEAAERTGFTHTKINCVLMGGFNDDEIEDFVDLTRDRDLTIRFIELMPIGEGLDQSIGHYVSCGTVLSRVPELEPVTGTEDELNEAYLDGVARLYRLPYAKGKVGLIRPMSCDFCDSCDKIRLTADGKIKPCLHLPGEISIKGLSREEMKVAMERAISTKPKHRDKMDAAAPSQAGRNMNQIGG